MKEMDDLLRFCAERYERIECANCTYSESYSQTCNYDCYSCLRKIHRVLNHNIHYCCERILYQYVLKYQLRYASELARCFYYILSEVSSITPLKVYSLGCGPASELYGLFGVAGYLNYPWENVVYKGFDLDKKWDSINNYTSLLFFNCKVSFLYEDMFFYVQRFKEHMDVLVLNYMLSDSMRYSHAETDKLLDKVFDLFSQGLISYVIINDIALYYTDIQKKTAYVCMKKLERKLMENHVSFQHIKKRYTNPICDYIERYGTLFTSRKLAFHVPEFMQNYSPFNSCNSISFIIKKV